MRTAVPVPVPILNCIENSCFNKESFGLSTFANFILQINVAFLDIFDLPIYSSKKLKSWKSFWQNTG
jgi:hypothetical protein